MNDLLKALWLVGKVCILLLGVGAILGGGICGVMSLPAALSQDRMARDLLAVAGIVLAVGLVLAIPTWRSLRRERLANRARQAAELEALRRRAGGM